MPLISVTNLEKMFPDGTRALRGVSFEIEKGEFVAIMGPSGSGKSTLLHILGFLDTQSGGEYRFSGKTLADLTSDEVAKIRNTQMGFVFQAFNLLPRTNVIENVMLPLLYAGVPRKDRVERAKEAIELVGLSHRVTHDVSKLSGGEKQRVAIARALVNQPDIIFADEPTGNLDSASGQLVMDFIQRLNEERGHTVILITHESDTAEHAERILFVRDGKIASDEKVKKRRFARDGFTK